MSPQTSTLADAAEFNENGVVLVRGLLDARLVGELRESCARARPSGEAAGFWNVSNLWRTDDAVRETIADERVAGTLARLLGSRALWLFEETLLIKEAGSTEPTPWHQDLTHYPLAGSMVATMWISLDAVAPDGGRVLYVKGSHRWGKHFASVGFSTGETYDGPGLEQLPQDIREERSRLLQSFATEPGDCIVHHGLTLHGAPGNMSGSARRALAVSVFGDDVTYRPAILPVVHASEPMLREGRALEEVFPRLWPQTQWTQ